ncbi:MAG TPA: CHAT domain-containing protein [Thermoanaerobaculia bacterium]|nr:CHAT domain-containing protein [Thermoanaerobaculia bacterium]
MRNRRLLRLGLTISSAIVLAICVTSGVARWKKPRETSVDRLVRVLASMPKRPVAGRLSPPFDVHVSHATARAPGKDAPTHALTAAAAEVILGSEEEGMQPGFAAVAHLLLGESLTAAGALASLAESNPTPDVLANLAAAYLAVAEQDASFDSNLDALAAADQALAISRSHPAAAFNRAVALARLGFTNEARAAWLDSARTDPSSDWARESQLEAERLQPPSRTSWRETDAEAAVTAKDDSILRQMIRESPRLARSWAEAVFPARWAEAFLSGDSEAASRAVGSARAIASVLASEVSERMAADAVAVIDGAPGRTASQLAHAYLRYRKGRVMYSEQKPIAAEPLFRESEMLFSLAKSPMALVARYYLASALYSQGRIDDAERLLEQLTADPLAERGYRSLAAQIGWERGLCLVLRGSLSAAIDVYEQSRAGFSEIGDPDSRSAIDQLLANALEEAGDSGRAWIMRQSALETLGFFGRQERRSVFISSTADVLIYRREWRRAAALLEIAVKSAEQVKSAPLATQAHLQRALVRAMQGDAEGSRADLDAAARWRRSVTDEAFAIRLDAQQFFVEAVLAREVDPREAIAGFHRAAVVTRARGGIRSLTWIYLEQSRAERQLGDLVAARASLSRALEIIEEKRRGIHNVEQRALTFAPAAEIFSEAISLEIDAGDAGAAFDLSERSRARALLDRFELRDAAAREVANPYSSTEVRERLAQDAAIILYKSLPGRVAIFVVRPDGVSMATREKQTNEVRRLSLACADALTGRGKDLLACRRTREDLLGSVEHHLAGVTDAVVVLEPGLIEVPFAAIAGPGWRSLTEAPSATIALASALRARQRSVQRESIPVSFAATVFDRSSYPDAAPLRWARHEAEGVAALHPGTLVVAGDEATPDRLVGLLGRATMFHVAGHAVALGPRASQSRLLLAPSSGHDGSLDALRIAALNLSAARIVYLSACSSARPSGRVDGVDNLATAFLVAGAPAVIAAKWSVSDELAPAVATAFHREMAGGDDPAVAAQKTLLTSPSLGLVVVGASRHLIRPEGEQK